MSSVSELLVVKRYTPGEKNSPDSIYNDAVMNWSDEANAIVEELLRELPAPEREGVHEAARLHAESLAGEGGEDEVSMEIAVRAFIESTPPDLRSRLKHSLTYHGIDPEEFAQAFSA